MCGICRIFAFRGSFAVGEQLVTTMPDRIVHRGPDNGGTWTSRDGRVAFGHRRLPKMSNASAWHDYWVAGRDALASAS